MRIYTVHKKHARIQAVVLRFMGFHLIPQRIKLFKRRILKGDIVFFGELLHTLESQAEFARRRA